MAGGVIEPVDVRLLGGVTVTRDGSSVRLRSRRTAALLGYLAGTAGPVSRTVLATMLWPDRDDAAARTNLRGLLSHLRRDTGDLVEVDRQTVRLRPGADRQVDVRRFEAAADEAMTSLADEDAITRLQAAWGEYGGDLLAGVDLELAGPFDDWLAAERSRLHLRAVAVLEALVDAHLGEAVTGEAVSLAQRLVDLDPLREASQRRLLQASWRAGNAAAALQHYDAWTERLAEELGVVPDPELTALVDRIRRGDTPGRRGPRRPARRLADHRPLVARHAELAQLVEVVTGTAEAGAAVVVGEAGMGKTRLVREALDEVARAGLPTAWVVGTRVLSTMPYASVAHLAPQVEPTRHADAASLHRAYTAALLRRSTDGPFVLGVDDAHLLDDQTASLLLHLVVTGAARLAVTLRPSPEPPDAVIALWKDGWARRLDLQRLTHEDVADLVRARLAGPVGETTRRRIATKAHGNPLYVHEIVDGALEEGSLRRVAGVWHWDGTVPMASGLVDAVRRRVDRLDPADRHLLGIVALGVDLPLDVVEEVGAGDVGELETHGLVTVEESSGSVHVAHPLHGEVVLDVLGAVERQRVRRRLVDLVEASGTGRTTDVLRVMTWRLDAGLPTDTSALVDGARLANASFDHALAARLADAALDRGAGAEAALARAVAARHRNEWDRADTVLADHAEALLSSSDPATARTYLRQRVAALSFGLGRTEDALALLDAAASRDLPAAVGTTLTALRAVALHDLGRTRDALRTGAPLLTDALDPEGRLDAIRALTPPLVDVGRGDEAWQVAAGHPAPDSLHAQLSELALVMTVAGDMDAGIARLQSLRAEVRAGPSHHDRLQVGIALGQAHFVRGTVEPARRSLREVMAGLDATDARGIAPLVWSGLARAEAMGGDHAAADRAMRSAEDQDRGNPPARFRADFATARAWVAAARGDLAAAQAAAMGAIEHLGERPAREAVMLHTAMRFGAPVADVADRLDEITPGMSMPLVSRFAAHARALHRGDVVALEDLADRLEDVGQWVLAAEVLAGAARATSNADRPRLRDRGRDVLDRCTGLVPVPSTIDGLAP